jgi:hypothetical protein
MGIKSIDQDRRMPRLGKIHLGIRKFKNPQDKKGYPSQTDYFVVPPELEPIYGNRPTALDIMFASNDVDAVLPHWYKLYGQSSVAPLCRGDGAKAQRLDLKTAERIEVECPGPRECKFNQEIDETTGLVKEKGCSPIGSLMIWLYKAPGLGVYQIDTGAWNGIRELLSELNLMQAALGGRIAWVPLKLKLIQREVNRLDPVKGLVKTKVRILSIQYEKSLQELAQTSPSLVRQTVALPAPDESRPDEEDKGEEILESLLQQATPTSVLVPPTREQLAAIGELGAKMGLEEWTKLGLVSIQVAHEPATVTFTNGKTLPMDQAGAADLIRRLQPGYRDEDAQAFAERFV